MVDLILCAAEMWRLLAFAVSLVWLIDAVVRRILAWAARARHHEDDGVPAAGLRWVVVVPARTEGRAVLSTLQSVSEAARGYHVRTILLLDGGDPETEQAAKEMSVSTVTKEPAGPTKGAALGWLVENHADLLDGTDAVLIIDVGSRLSPGFFRSLAWPRGADVVQARLHGEGAGIGRAASLSESAAQLWQDRGRQALGWSVQLRGTGTAYTPAALTSVVPRLKTSIEDTEATLLLAAHGGCSVLGGEQAWVEDIKPQTLADAARQRSRWLSGQLALLLRQPGALLRLIVHSPLEGFAFATGLMSRPLSLTALARLVLAVVFAVDSLIGARGVLAPVACALLIVSLMSDLALVHRATEKSWVWVAAGGVRMLLAWGSALLLLPRALFGWVRTRRD